MHENAGQRRAVLWSSPRGTPESVLPLHGVDQMFSCLPIVTVTEKPWNGTLIISGVSDRLKDSASALNLDGCVGVWRRTRSTRHLQVG
jgi:hypothetical protein